MANNGQMFQGICKACGGAFWESYQGARGEDLCDHCEDKPPSSSKRFIGVIDCTPTWQSLVPAMIAMLQDGSPQAQQTAKEELARMAGLADRHVASQKQVKVTFEEAWAKTGYQYGDDALENVRLGFSLASGDA